MDFIIPNKFANMLESEAKFIETKSHLFQELTFDFIWLFYVFQEYVLVKTDLS